MSNNQNKTAFTSSDFLVLKQENIIVSQKNLEREAINKALQKAKKDYAEAFKKLAEE